MLKKSDLILLLLIVFIALFVRFYNFTNRINFGPEQAISLLVSGNMVKEKFTLLGFPSTQRTTSFGHIIYYPPIFNYSLIPLLLIFNYNPIPITGYFALLNLITGVAIFFLALKLFNKKAAYFALIIFLFDSFMIYHSLFIWVINYLPILMVLNIYLTYKFLNFRNNMMYPLLIGLVTGISFGLEYLYFFTAILIGILVFIITKSKLRSTLLFILGGFLGNLPTVIFDLTHDFYHLKTLWQYFLDTISNPGQSHIAYYHFLQFWPIIALIGGFVLNLLYKKNTFIAVIVVIFYVTLNLISPNVSFNRAVGMYPALNISKIREASNIIALDNPKEFNVVMTFDFDSRAHPLRYFLKFMHGKNSLSEEAYPNAKTLYVFSQKNYDIKNTNLWEIKSFNAKKLIKLSDIDDFAVYKLLKDN